MEYSLKQVDLFEKYIDKQMNMEEIIAFENEMQSDSNFSLQFELLISLNRSLQKKEVIDFRKCLIEIRQSMLNNDLTVIPKPGIVLSNKYWLKIAAIVLLITGMGIFFYMENNDQTVSNQKLYAINYLPYPANQVMRSDTKQNTLIDVVLKSYDSANYANALLLISELPKQNLPDKLFLIQGICFLETNHLPEAIQTFDQLAHNTKSLFYRDAQWYLALSYLRNDNSRLASSLLKEIEFSKSPYNKKAGNILKKMKP